MAWNHDEISFRDMAGKCLLVKDIDTKTRVVIENSEFKIRKDDNAMLVYGYIDYEAGLSFELLCAACVYDDGEIAFEPQIRDTSCKFRYGSFKGDMVPFEDAVRLAEYKDRIDMICKGYSAPPVALALREIKELDSSRAPGFPDDILVYFMQEGYQTEGIWSRIVSSDVERHLLQMRILNEPYAPFGKHIGDIVDVELIPMDNGEMRAAAVL